MWRFWTVFINATLAIADRPIRSILTSLGIIIGVASIFAVFTLGEFAETQVNSAFDTINSRTISITTSNPDSRLSQSVAPRKLSTDDLPKLMTIDGLSAVTGTLSVPSRSIAGNGRDIQSTVTGVDPQYQHFSEATLLRGRHITPQDLLSKAPVAIVSQGVSLALYDSVETLGNIVKINGMSFQITAILLPEDETLMDPKDSFIWIPITTARQRLVGGDRYVKNHIDRIIALGTETADFDYLDREITYRLRQSRGRLSGEKNDFRTFSLASLRGDSMQAIKIVSYVLATMGFITLLVGGIGVMNVMVMSVSERTFEIGLLRALGAYESDILWQFLVEAVILCALSGLIGIGLGYLSFAVINLAIEADVSIEPSLSVGLRALVAASMIGVIFGFLPARRAAKMLPIDALRHE